MGYKQYCKDYENIENYEAAKADNFKGWECHHRLETHNSDGLRRPVDITRKELIALGMYYRRPASELVFLTSREHTALHKKGKPKTEEAKKKLSEANKGKRLSEETKKKMSEVRKGHPVSEETRRRISEGSKGKPGTVKGKHCFNNGKENKFCFECPEGFTPGMLR